MAARPNREMLRDQPEVQVPTAADDRPAWGRVAALALVGFAVGIAWPRLAGVRLGPSAPSDAIPAAASASPDHSDGALANGSAVPAALTAPAAPSGAPIGSAPPVEGVGSGAPAVSVGRGQVLSCHGADGALHKGTAGCGDLSALDAIMQPRIRRLSSCTAADAQVGKLAVLLGVDFDSGKVSATFGKSSTLQNIDSVGVCLKMQLNTVALGAIAHDQPRYTVLYNTSFTTRDPNAGREVPVAATAAASGSAASGDEPTAQVVWDVAIVRDKPKTGTVIGRLQRGTNLHVASGQDGWYRVKYGSSFTSEGWVYRGAIGK